MLTLSALIVLPIHSPAPLPEASDLLSGVLDSAVPKLDSVYGRMERPAPPTVSGIEALICARFTTNCAAAVRVARCESTLNPRAYNAGNYGLFQINAVHARRVSGDLTSLYDAATNVRVAHAIWSEQGWRPWACQP